MPLVLNPISGQFDYKGIDFISQSRAPTSADASYAPPYGWLDTTNDAFYILTDVTSGVATWVEIGASSDVSGPASSTDNAITRWDGTGGDTLQNSSGTLDDNGLMVLPVGGTGTPTAGYFFVDNGTGIYESSSDNIRFRSGGTDAWNISSTTFGGFNVGEARISHTAAPQYTFLSDTDTGMGRTGANALSLYTGAVAALSIDSSQNIAVAGTVDGRDIAADGSTLDTAILDADFGSNGMMARTASGSYASRTITGTSNEISVSNGTGASGNPTLSLPSTIDLGGKTLEIPNSASFAPSAVGHFGLDTSITDYTPLLKYHDGTEEFSVVAMPSANLGTNDGYVVSYNATNDEFELVASGGGSGDVTAAANMTDNAVVRGDGGAKGVQDSGITISDADLMTIPSGGTAGIRFGDGDTGFYETSDDFLEFYVGGTEVMRFQTGAGLAYGVNFGNGAGGTQFIPAAFSTTAPGYSFLNDLDTGLGLTNFNDIYIMAGGTKTIESTASQIDLNVACAATSLTLTTDLAVDHGGNGRSSATAYAVICGGTTSTGAHQSIASVGTSGQVLTSNGAGALPTFQDASGGGLTWNEETGTSATMSVNNAYIANNASLVTLTLPTTAAVGDIVRVVGKGAGGWKIAQNASEIIHYSSVDTTTGTGGSLDSTNQYDSVELVCTVANTEWTYVSGSGSPSAT